MKKWWIKGAKILTGILVAWSVLTILVQIKGPEKLVVLGHSFNGQKALLVYDPDPFYNLDEQVCRGFADGLMEFSNWEVTIATVRAAEKINSEEFDLYLFCANTYNWAPDWALSRFVKKQKHLSGKPAVAITLGSGSTGRAQRILESHLKQVSFKLLQSETYWLMRPNDESRLEESNITVAVESARNLGIEVSENQRKFSPTSN